MAAISFEIKEKIPGKLGRTGVLSTLHGEIKTPAFVVVGTKATVKALSPEQVRDLDAQVVLGNTYHLYLQPGDELVRDAGGLREFMNWSGPTMTDSGGFQVFSLGVAFGSEVNKFSQKNSTKEAHKSNEQARLAKIDEDGVTFRSHIDGSEHRFTPERSIEIQHNIGADMIFAFDECTSPHAEYEYQTEAMERTHRWAKRSLDFHKNSGMSDTQALFGIVQGGRFEDLRKESAQVIGKMDFDGFGVGGSFEKEDIDTAVGWVNALLPEEKPRHLLGIGEPLDIFGGIENGVDLFDCVAPTRMARNGTLYTKDGRMNILNAKYVNDFLPIEGDCGCYTCAHYTRSYVTHLFRAKEMFAATLASIHNLAFIIGLVAKIREEIANGTFFELKESFLERYYRSKV
ncbi:MAG: tRNA guanosine(34) transglycosylase Tgt [Candidatus Yonathbacteria bacterium CG_4_10_14_3_um_filter_47_65]|uniref:Queuine tRNA-ribosyltransferase n=2 Tax=Parcubacteria group TaxID=1794811 RepID=A0A2M8D6W3_9BACT|nr:MAG: tRNA guanosine(34) transglycosylase Tgt [Candidatus Nomurabacteria bacterium CG1_02_47_685]PIP03221.1 MAG: tRNA guanosine(34) transglycosylase Tgt [Candidatus Yonathbacteria bacterium CG23_combo_of_CG06-09_8_20_14_all_46_18]PIQ33080.1 MAG: tRNA guanosine(34) transglycosylase Tgt [Candidatus Yonathbacteria bacterium CG17_big_fil_post_rev_8_21_14_2_50_46_19]PIX56644.1 MAG: tRNA guanosine(34) transglycosylase Tgt [Candidatus Yonathbacteria bacterium CG_4_10_14_3_um_filter_47_65]PIY57790.1 